MCSWLGLMSTCFLFMRFAIFMIARGEIGLISWKKKKKRVWMTLKTLEFGGFCFGFSLTEVLRIFWTLLNLITALLVTFILIVLLLWLIQLLQLKLLEGFFSLFKQDAFAVAIALEKVNKLISLIVYISFICLWSFYKLNFYE